MVDVDVYVIASMYPYITSVQVELQYRNVITGSDSLSRWGELRVAKVSVLTFNQPILRRTRSILRERSVRICVPNATYVTFDIGRDSLQRLRLSTLNISVQGTKQPNNYVQAPNERKNTLQYHRNDQQCGCSIVR